MPVNPVKLFIFIRTLNNKSITFIVIKFAALFSNVTGIVTAVKLYFIPCNIGVMFLFIAANYKESLIIFRSNIIWLIIFSKSNIPYRFAFIILNRYICEADFIIRFGFAQVTISGVVGDKV